MLSTFQSPDPHILDMALRVEAFDKPFVLTTVDEFVSDIVNTEVVRVALGFPLPQHTAPSPFE